MHAMNGRNRPTGNGWLTLLAFAGLLIGHFLAYALVAPDAGVRAAILQATGHAGHAGLFVPVGGAALLAAAIGLVVRQVRRDDGGEGSRFPAARLVRTLWILQTAAFAALEASERALSGHAVNELLHEPTFLVGLAVQVLIACAGAVLVLLLRATVEALRRYLDRPASRTAGQALRPPRSLSGRPSQTRWAWSLRGPPISTV